MIDIGTISGGLAVAKGVYEALAFIKGLAGADVISGYFRYDGTRIEGSDKIEIELHHDENSRSIW